MSWPGNVIGRDGELGYATTLLAQLADGPAALVFAGEPGIGKTTVLLAAERAGAASAVVLSAHPVEAEAELGFAALADLLAPVVDELLPALPEPQRHALAVVLLLEEPGSPLDRRAVCAATLSGLRMAAARGPVVLAIDDLQWLDASSARVLDFALRRLGGLPVGVVACERAGAGQLTGRSRRRGEAGPGAGPSCRSLRPSRAGAAEPGGAAAHTQKGAWTLVPASDAGPDRPGRGGESVLRPGSWPAVSPRTSRARRT